jgi:hypothetical protein
LVAIQGNVGQANYCAANRAMSASVRAWSRTHENLIAKALMLPPIEGTGMADDPEVKELMKRKGLSTAFVHADELAQLFCHELCLAPPRPSWIAMARTFPKVKGTLVEANALADDAQGKPMGSTVFKPAAFPLIETVTELDLQKGALTARRTFSQDHDLWIADHKPFKALKHPLVSGIMAVEAFLEAAQLLCPHLAVTGIRQMTFEDILECPADIEREARIVCRRQVDAIKGTCCDVRLASLDLSPSGRRLDRWSTNYRGQVLLGTARPLPSWPKFTISPTDLESRAMQAHEIEESYEARTGLKGRYRVLERIDGTAEGMVKGAMCYRQQADFSHLNATTYRYSPYLLEALMHLIVFYAASRRPDEPENLIPAGIKQMRFSRQACRDEHINLEARRRSHDAQGYSWNAQALNASGTPIMQLEGLRMNRFRL